MLNIHFARSTFLVLLGCAACSSAEPPPAATATAEPTVTQGAEQAPPPAEAPAANSASAAQPTAPTTVAFSVEAGLATPESVLYDAKRDLYYVSNINGSPLEADDNGYIMKLGADGKVLAEKWIDGAGKNITLSAPKGMALVGDTLYVADLDHVRMFDVEKGKPKGQVQIKGATFLNDVVAADDGTVYVSDSGLKGGAQGFEPSGSDAIHVIGKGNEVKALIQKPELGRPNGLAVQGDQLLVVTFGSGQLYTVSRVDGTQGAAQDLPGGQLDGIQVMADGRLLISSWGGKHVLAGTLGGTFTPVIENVEAPADICFVSAHDRVVVPMFMGNKLVAYDLPKTVATAPAPAQ